jgi:hypothetical protein
MTISECIKFGSAGRLDTLENKSILGHFKVVIGVYVNRFQVAIIIANN